MITWEQSGGWELGFWCRLPGFEFGLSNSQLLCDLGMVLNNSVLSFFTCKMEVMVTLTSEARGSEMIYLKCLMLGEHWIPGRGDSFYSPSIGLSTEHLVAAN